MTGKEWKVDGQVYIEPPAVFGVCTIYMYLPFYLHMTLGATECVERKVLIDKD